MKAFPKVEAFVWSDKLATGIGEVDVQHQQLVRLINEIGSLCTAGADSTQLKPVLDELVSYAVYHFEEEEQLMRRYAVSEAHQKNHVKAHDDFRKQVSLAVGIIQTAPQDSMSLLAQLLEYLARWLLQHIMVVDLRMAREIQALQAGVAPDVAANQAAATVSHSGEVMLEALNTLYGKIGEQTVEVMQANRALEQERAALRELNEQLEQRVAQRTAALELSNRQLIQSNAELQQLNRKLASAQSQLLQAEKMASIGQLAAGVAHEINNPVGFVNSNLSTLEQYIFDLGRLIEAYGQAESGMAADALAGIAAVKREVDLPYLLDDVPKLLKESQDGLARVKRIILDLREFSHVDEATWQLVDLEQCMDSTLNVAWNEIKYKAEVKKEYAGLPEVECMPSQINQVFLNLLVNAAQAIDSGGTITIRTGRQGDEIYVEVADTGKGIAPEHLNQIFDPFFTTKPVGQGTGLGLAVSYGIVQKHGGRIEVNSILGKGTAIRVWLPVKHMAG
ncbi:MAG TPA: bacteriohemerythrin [Sideroxyarcus sp.]|nr:bacteriohemerythrin [Sideroxyarcus sp.]